MLSADFQARFQGKAKQISKTGMTGILQTNMKPVEKEGWKEYLENRTVKQNTETEKQLISEIREINQLQRSVLPKLSKALNFQISILFTSIEQNNVLKVMPKRKKNNISKINLLINKNINSITNDSSPITNISHYRSTPNKHLADFSPLEEQRVFFPRGNSHATNIQRSTKLISEPNFRDYSTFSRQNSSQNIFSSIIANSPISKSVILPNREKFRNLQFQEENMQHKTNDRLMRNASDLNSFLNNMRNENRTNPLLHKTSQISHFKIPSMTKSSIHQTSQDKTQTFIPISGVQIMNQREYKRKNLNHFQGTNPSVLSSSQIFHR